MEEKIFSVLRSVGFAKNEVIVYLDLLTQKNSGAIEVARRTKLHKANVYTALEGLTKNGFVTTVFQENKRLFRAQNPSTILKHAKQREQEIKDIIPAIRTISPVESDEESEVLMSKGVLALRNSLFALLRYRKPLDMYGIPSSIFETVGEGFFQEFHKERIKKGIPMRLIFNEDLEVVNELNVLNLTEVRYSGLMGIFAPVVICDSTILMIVLSPQVSVIEIKNSDIVDGYLGHFEILWKHAKK